MHLNLKTEKNLFNIIKNNRKKVANQYFSRKSLKNTRYRNPLYWDACIKTQVTWK